MDTDNDELVITNVLRKTPSKQRVKKMLAALSKSETPHEVKEQILEYISLKGLPTDLALECATDGIFCTINGDVLRALEYFKEVEDVKFLQKKNETKWKKFLSVRAPLSYEAQKEMLPWQLKIYLAEGFMLNEELLVSYMKDMDMRSYLLPHIREKKEVGLITEKIHLLLITEEWWREKML